MNDVFWKLTSSYIVQLECAAYLFEVYQKILIARHRWTSHIVRRTDDSAKKKKTVERTPRIFKPHLGWSLTLSPDAFVAITKHLYA